jgi:hypothetical protein
MSPLWLATALALLAVGAPFAAASGVQYTYPWQDPTLPVPARVANLISLLNVTEKVALLSADSPALPRLSLPAYSWGRECERGDGNGPLATSYVRVVVSGWRRRGNGLGWGGESPLWCPQRGDVLYYL